MIRLFSVAARELHQLLPGNSAPVVGEVEAQCSRLAVQAMGQLRKHLARGTARHRLPASALHALNAGPIIFVEFFHG
jgi:hypothetical protein